MSLHWPATASLPPPFVMLETSYAVGAYDEPLLSWGRGNRKANGRLLIAEQLRIGNHVEQ